MQAIHSAACSGQAEVIMELIENLGVDPREKADVRLSISEVWGPGILSRTGIATRSQRVVMQLYAPPGRFAGTALCCV
jgi:hypothetical protein